MEKIFLIIILGSLLFPSVSLAISGGLVPCGGPGEPSCQFCHLFVMFDRIIDFLLAYIVFPVAVLLLVIGGAIFLLSTGNPSAITQGKSIMTSVIIGLVIIFGAWLFINLFFSIIGVADWTGLEEGWFTIDCPVPGAAP